MGSSTVTKTVVTADGVLALEIKVDGNIYSYLMSDIVPQCKADIKKFAFYVLGETQVYSKEDYKPFSIDENKNPKVGTIGPFSKKEFVDLVNTKEFKEWAKQQKEIWEKQTGMTMEEYHKKPEGKE